MPSALGGEGKGFSIHETLIVDRYFSTSICQNFSVNNCALALFKTCHCGQTVNLELPQTYACSYVLRGIGGTSIRLPILH